jgi:acyl-CoA reductase-like NAD-dependent aldehyde dehydrogenase
VVAKVPIATKKVVDDAVSSARKAFPSWSRLTWDQRKEKLQAWHDKDYVNMHKDLIPLYVAEQGRTLQMAEIEFGLVEGFWNLGAYHQPKDEVIEDDGNNKHILRKYPLGVSAALVPCEC